MPQPLILVTGANSGIGKATALGLAQGGSHVLLHARDHAKGQAAVEEIKAQAPQAQVDLLLADLAIQSEVRALAQQVKERYGRLDVLLNNAAIIPRQRTLTRDGIEQQLAVNHLAYFLLAHLLLELLQAAPQGRIVNVSSTVHQGARLQLDDLQAERSYGMGFGQYGSTKLMNILFTLELAQHLKETSVTVNCLHPGVISSQLLRDIPLAATFSRWFFGSPQSGAQTSLYLATSPAVTGVTGRYFVKSKPAAYDSRADDPQLRAQLWQHSTQLVGLA
jgi:NAD(P)-dependent dehydrogenase (short-subunit alcohol dehydrogenase family)